MSESPSTISWTVAVPVVGSLVPLSPGPEPPIGSVTSTRAADMTLASTGAARLPVTGSLAEQAYSPYGISSTVNLPSSSASTVMTTSSAVLCRSSKPAHRQTTVAPLIGAWVTELTTIPPSAPFPTPAKLPDPSAAPATLTWTTQSASPSVSEVWLTPAALSKAVTV